MNNKMKWIENRVRLGWLLTSAGLLLGGVGIVLERTVPEPAFNLRIITGFGILLIGIGLANLVRYGPVRRDPQAARRLSSEERDERMQLLRARAGSRAYWVSTGLAYILLMWLSFASSGSLPALSDDVLWLCMAGVVVIPFAVYAASLVYDQQHN